MPEVVYHPVHTHKPVGIVYPTERPPDRYGQWTSVAWHWQDAPTEATIQTALQNPYSPGWKRGVMALLEDRDAAVRTVLRHTREQEEYEAVPWHFGCWDYGPAEYLSYRDVLTAVRRYPSGLRSVSLSKYRDHWCGWGPYSHSPDTSTHKVFETVEAGLAWMRSQVDVPEPPEDLVTQLRESTCIFDEDGFGG